MCSLQTKQADLLLSTATLRREELSWYAVQTRPRFEKAIHAALHLKGLEVYLPLHSSLHQWSDRRRLVELPLFPGYLFIRMLASMETRVAVLRTNGVSNFVGGRGVGSVIPDSEIEALRAVVERKIPFQPHSYLQVGQRVRIRSGCLEDVTGTLTSINGDLSLVISVNLIQRSIVMRIQGYEVEPIQ